MTDARQGHDQEQIAEDLRRGVHDKSLNPNSLIEVTFTAAEIAARWDTDLGFAAVPIPRVGVNRWIWTVTELVNDLDQGVGESGYSAALPGATTVEVNESGEGFNKHSIYYVPGTYLSSVEIALPGSPTRVMGQWLEAGAMLYVLFYGDAPPTSGSATERLILSG